MSEETGAGPAAVADPTDWRSMWPTAAIPDLAEQRRLEHLKAGLLTAGLRLTARAQERLLEDTHGHVTEHEYPTTGGLTLDLGSEVAVNAPVDEWFCPDSPFVLETEAGAYVVIDGAGEVHPVVRHIPLPRYLGAVDGAGRPVTDTCFSHADRVRLSPIVGCAYQCDYCDLPAERYTRREPEQLIAALDVALADQALPPRHVMISGGSPGPKHVEWFVETILAVAAACPLPLDVMMSALPGRTDVVDRLVDGGVSGFSINLELFGDEASQLHIRGKHRHARPGFDAFVECAVSRLGHDGSVRSLLVVGLEPPSVAIAGLEHIVSLGADPVISPFRPAARTSLADHRPPTADEVLGLLEEARGLVAGTDAHLGPRCIPCQHNTLTFPWDVRAADPA